METLDAIAGNFLPVAKQVGILFALMSVGFVCRRARLVDEAAVKGMVNLLILFVTPCLIVECFQRPCDAAKLKSLGAAFAFAAAAHVALIAAASALYRRTPPDTRCVLRLATAFSNAGFMGIPLEHALFGDEGVFYGIAYVVVFNIFIWSWGYGVMRGCRWPLDAKQVATICVNPGTVGLAIALPLFLLSVRLPPVVAAPVSMMASMNTPLAMVVIGFYLGGAKLGAVASSGGAWFAAALRLVAFPLAAVAVFAALGGRVDRTMALASVTASAAPAAAMVSMLASKFNRDIDASVGVVSGTTLLSILTMPLVIAIAMAVL
jgi:hypothetical protein